MKENEDWDTACHAFGGVDLATESNFSVFEPSKEYNHLRVERIRQKGRLRAKVRNRTFLILIVLAFLMGWFLAVTFIIPTPISSSIEDSLEIEAVAAMAQVVPQVSQELQYIDVGEWTITAYCPCEICCGKWAENRPNEKVFGAYGIELREGHSCAAPLPCGTVLDIDGVGKYTVMDTTADWIVDKYDGKIVDIYFETHEEAVNFGKQVTKIRIIR